MKTGSQIDTKSANITCKLIIYGKLNECILIKYILLHVANHQHISVVLATIIRVSHTKCAIKSVLFDCIFYWYSLGCPDDGSEIDRNRLVINNM
jgi:hypothetical protein